MSDDYESMIHDYINGHLTTEDAADFEQHLATCMDCRAALDRWWAQAWPTASPICRLRLAAIAYRLASIR